MYTVACTHVHSFHTHTNTHTQTHTHTHTHAQAPEDRRDAEEDRELEVLAELRMKAQRKLHARVEHGSAVANS